MSCSTCDGKARKLLEFWGLKRAQEMALKVAKGAEDGWRGIPESIKEVSNKNDKRILMAGWMLAAKKVFEQIGEEIVGTKEAKK